MNLKKGKFKIVEGTRVRMISSKDIHIVEGAYGTVVNSGIRESEVRWDSMLAIRADYRSALPYEVIMDKGDCVWVAGCTIQNVDTEVYIEEYSADVENEVSPDEDILENGFSRQVTFYEKD